MTNIEVIATLIAIPCTIFGLAGIVAIGYLMFKVID